MPAATRPRLPRLASATLALAVAGCGASGDTALPNRPTSADIERAAAAFERCLEAHGVAAPRRAILVGAGSLPHADTVAVRALKACRPGLPTGRRPGFAAPPRAR